MARPGEPIPDDRPLSRAEYQLADRMLRLAGAAGEAFLPQLARARVVSRCGCGCVSVDLAVAGEAAPAGGLHILGDFEFDDGGVPAGIFIFEQGGVLAGVEVWAMGGDTPTRLPVPDALRPLGESTSPAP